MSCDDLGHQLDALLRRHIRQANQSCVRNVMQIDQLPEVRINRSQDSVFGLCKFQERLIPWVGTKLPGLKYIVSRAAEPVRQTAASNRSTRNLTTQ